MKQIETKRHQEVKHYNPFDFVTPRDDDLEQLKCNVEDL